MGTLGRAFTVYSGFRLVLFVVSFLLLTAVDVRGLVAIALALLISSILSLVVLRRQRDDLGRALLERNARRGQEKARLQAMLQDRPAENGPPPPEGP